MNATDDLPCPFRQEVQSDGENETAVCDFLRRLTGAPGKHCRVDRTACQICLQHSPLSPSHLNPVLPSLILGVCDSAFPAAPQDSPEGALRDWAQGAVATEGAALLAPLIHGCDCVLFCETTGSESQWQTFLDSVINQDGIQPIIHLVVFGDGEKRLAKNFESQPNIRVHHLAPNVPLAIALNHIARHLETQWLTVFPRLIRLPSTWLKSTLETMETDAAEVFVTSQLGDATDEWNEPLLVTRRGTLVDMDGFSEMSTRLAEPTSVLKEFAARAQQQGREVIADSGLKLPSPTQEREQRNATEVARTFPVTPVACDVVLPFRDSLDQVRQALDGLLAQEDADVLIHLVDDDSQTSTDDFFSAYKHYSNIRFYRNRHNIGPFASFNNIALVAENEWIAVQDGDDISLPHRIARSCHLLRSAQADILGCRTELFGEPNLVERIAHETIQLSPGDTRHVRNSRYPKRNLSGYFLENPSLVMRLSSFQSLGGYGDFGSVKRNRTGVDTDFQVRAHYARAATIVTRETLLRYRCHGASAVHHSETGFGSQANAESHAEVRRRFVRYCTGTFDPRWFGALGQHQGITERIDP